MRTLIVLSLIMSLSAFAQTRVRENIKQQAVTGGEPVKSVPGKPVKK